MDLDSYSYDENGNQVTRNVSGSSYTLGYDAENRLVSVAGAATATFVYDGDGNRVKGEIIGGATTTYIGNYAEWISGSPGSLVKYYYAGATRVAMKNSDLYYLLGDHLGSTSVTANINGVKSAEVRYYPWGTERYTYSSTLTTFRFTGQRFESGIGLYFYNARFYDPAAGRFISADTMIPEPQGVQAWDRYAYVNNNPINYTDPSGNGMCDENWADPIDCAEADPDGDGIVLVDPSQTSPDLEEVAIDDGYDKDDIKRGRDIFNALRGNRGWWEKYIDWSNPESVWRFILSLAYTYESYPLYSDQNFLNQMTVAFSSQFWDLMDSYGNAGGLIYIGTMETLNIRVVSLFNDVDHLNLRTTFEQVLSSTSVTIINQSKRSIDPNAPYDFGTCPGTCPYTKGTGIDQAIWLSGGNQAYIRSRYQFYGRR